MAGTVIGIAGAFGGMSILELWTARHRRQQLKVSA
jgi:hypothetical protein